MLLPSIRTEICSFGIARDRQRCVTLSFYPSFPLQKLTGEVARAHGFCERDSERPGRLELPTPCFEAAGPILPNLARGSAIGALSASWGNSPRVTFSFVSPHFPCSCVGFLQVALRFRDRWNACRPSAHHTAGRGRSFGGYSDSRSNSTGSMKTEFQEKRPDAAYQLQLDLADKNAQKFNPRVVEIDL